MALHGLLVEFATPEELGAALDVVLAAGYCKLDAYTPFPVEELGEKLAAGRSPVAPITLLAGLAGGATAYAMQWLSAVVDYPINVGGRPLHSVPAFVPITFELTVLFAALAAGASVFFLSGLPALYHPVFNVDRFERASYDRFFLCVEADDPRFDVEQTRRLLETLGGEGVYEVPA